MQWKSCSGANWPTSWQLELGPFTRKREGAFLRDVVNTPQKSDPNANLDERYKFMENGTVFALPRISQSSTTAIIFNPEGPSAPMGMDGSSFFMEGL